MKYFSIRVVEAESLDDAIEKVQDNIFDEDHPLCDVVLNKDNFTIDLMKS